MLSGDLGLLADDGRRLAHLAGGDLEILLAQGRHHVAGGHPASGELVGIEPDPHAVVALAEHPDVADARQPREHGLDLDGGVIRQVELVIAPVGRINADRQQNVGRLLLGRHSGRP